MQNYLNPIALLRSYEILKQCHYFTKHGFHHEQYDALVKTARKYSDAYIETFMYHNTKRGLVPLEVPFVPFVGDHSDVGLYTKARDCITRMLEVMTKASGGKADLEKLIQDFEQEAHQILALIQSYE